MSRPREVVSGSFLWGRFKDLGADSPCSQTKERRVYQNFRRQISDHGISLSQRHDPVYTGWDVPSQSANFPTRSNGSDGISHLEAVGATRWTGGRDHHQSQGWRKRQQTETRQVNVTRTRVIFSIEKKRYSGNGSQVTFEDLVSQRRNGFGPDTC